MRAPLPAINFLFFGGDLWPQVYSSSRHYSVPQVFDRERGLEALRARADVERFKVARLQTEVSHRVHDRRFTLGADQPREVALQPLRFSFYYVARLFRYATIFPFFSIRGYLGSSCLLSRSTAHPVQVEKAQVVCREMTDRLVELQEAQVKNKTKEQ